MLTPEQTSAVRNMGSLSPEDTRPNLRAVDTSAPNYAKGWRKGSAIHTGNLPKLGSVVVRVRHGQNLLIRVLAVTTALNSDFAGFVGVYCNRDGSLVSHAPRFYGSRKLGQGGFFKARQNHRQPLAPPSIKAPAVETPFEDRVSNQQRIVDER